MTINLIEENKRIEKAMVERSSDKMKRLMESNDEHSLQFSMFIKKTFGIVYDHIKSDPPPFEIYAQQSAYTISAGLIGCIFEEMPLRDLVRDKTRGLTVQLGWEVKLPYEYVQVQRESLFNGINKNHTRMFNLITTIIDHYPSMWHFKKTDLYAYQGVINSRVLKLYDDFMYVVSYNLDEYLNSINEYLVDYRKQLAYCVESYTGVANQQLINRTLNRLLSRYSVEDILVDINKEAAFIRDSDAADESMNDQFMIDYISTIINEVDFLSVVDGSDYGIVPAVVVGTDAIKKELNEYVASTSVLRPSSLPIIRKPLEWQVGETEGGFHHIDAPLVPAKKPHHKLPELPYLNALNRIQSSGFKINNWLFEAANKIGVLVPNKKKKPTGWSNERFVRYKKSMESKNRDMSRIMAIAEDYKDYDEFWFTMYCDFRYRMYYRQEYLSPQGQDLSKALLEFNVGMTVDKKALKWMRVNIANLGGKDDISYNERVKWVRRNESKIRELTTEPDSKASTAFLEKADKPWQFLAACIDYVMYLDNPDTHKSSLPVGMDGKCNGTQHWCAMLRDKVGGAKVALTDSDVPSDLYSEVLAKLMNKLTIFTKETLSDPDEDVLRKKLERQCWAIEWVGSGGMKRKLVKTPTMTTTYSAGKKAFRGYVANFCIDNGLVFSEDDAIQKQHINYMVDEIIIAIDSTVSAKSGMRFVQECVKGKDEAHWKSPLGAHVYMHPKRTFKREFNVKVDGQIRKITFSYEGDSTDHLAIHTGVSPNFIHMMDATHMAMTVNGCPQITHWMMIHDQFSCHAYFVDDMQKEIRHSFVELYKVDRLAEFREQQGLTEEDVPLPTYGDLDINCVKKSKYFFS
ncbi:hypothetical protein NVP3058O_129 [Vibrio phage 3.058.O._10N.286.46.B8]|nr:hypothetical protein NVP2058O_130 [Vibrio phage 2.058.O._10N.286.46.B8]AUS03199.1 hypothetical protein NVP3058O_129 [Vibrio phage 3.058.O._10N.286.46.B8]